jgi:uncharacterized membrane protein YphA (DoxX/SURF4 family)
MATTTSANRAMKLLIQNDYVVAAVRIFLGVVFVFASIDKIADPAAFAASIANYKLIGPQAGMLVATVLPWMELLSGMCLILGVLRQSSSLLILLMMIVFTAGVLSGIARGLDISCGCFSQDPQVGKIGLTKVLENIGLIAVSWFLFISKTDRFSLHHSPD